MEALKFESKNPGKLNLVSFESWQIYLIKSSTTVKQHNNYN